MLSLIGCKKPSIEPTPVDPVPPAQKQIPINISASPWTKATDSAFENGDKVGLYVVNYSGNSAGTLQNTNNHANNVSFIYDGAWTPDEAIYWKDDKTKADFYCYYPYAISVSDVNSYPFAVKADQSSQTGYKASEFLWGKTAGVSPTENPVDILTTHTMSNLLVYLEAGSGYNETDLSEAEVVICNVKNNATVNLTNGIATATGNITSIKPFKEDNHYRAMIVPQSIDNQELVKVTIGDKTYTLTQTINFTANKQHSCTITVNKTSNGINIGIGNWETDDIDHGGSVE